MVGAIETWSPYIANAPGGGYFVYDHADGDTSYAEVADGSPVDNEFVHRRTLRGPASCQGLTLAPRFQEKLVLER